MFRVSLQGPNAAAYLQCTANSNALAMMKRLKNAAARYSGPAAENGENWRVALEERHGEGPWMLIAYYSGQKH
jgi:hypothetical protein